MPNKWRWRRVIGCCTHFVMIIQVYWWIISRLLECLDPLSEFPAKGSISMRIQENPGKDHQNHREKHHCHEKRDVSVALFPRRKNHRRLRLSHVNLMSNMMFVLLLSKFNQIWKQPALVIIMMSYNNKGLVEEDIVIIGSRKTTANSRLHDDWRCLHGNDDEACVFNNNRWSRAWGEWSYTLFPVDLLLKLPWRNWLARSAVNRKVGGSSPPGSARSTFLPFYPLHDTFECYLQSDAVETNVREENNTLQVSSSLFYLTLCFWGTSSLSIPCVLQTTSSRSVVLFLDFFVTAEDIRCSLFVYFLTEKRMSLLLTYKSSSDNNDLWSAIIVILSSSVFVSKVVSLHDDVSVGKDMSVWVTFIRNHLEN